MERVQIEMVGDPQAHDEIRKAVAAGFFYNTARLQKDGSYKTVKNPQNVHIHPSSCLSEVRLASHPCLPALPAGRPAAVWARMSARQPPRATQLAAPEAGTAVGGACTRPLTYRPPLIPGPACWWP